MTRLLMPIAALLLSDALLLIGHGIQMTLLPIRAQFEGFTPTQIGLTGSAYFLGFVINCLMAPHIIKRVGHIRAFAVFCSLFSALVLLFHGFPYFEIWLVLRFCVGFCMSGLYMVIESWLNDRATRETRGTILSTYTVINLAMIVVGQQLLNLADPSGPVLLGITAVVLSLAIVPVSLTLTLAPAPIAAVKVDFRRVWALSHVGLGGAVVSGLITGAFWSMGPVFANDIGLDTAGLALFVSAVVLGGAVFQLPLGRLSDHVDRRLVVFWVGLVGAVLSALMALFAGGPLLYLLAVGWGAMGMTLYAICLAHATDPAQPEEFVMVGTTILLASGVSAVVGGPLASAFMLLVGPGGLFWYAALCQLLLAVSVSVRRHAHELPEFEEAEPFRSMADSVTPVALEMDPRTEGHDGDELEGDLEDEPGETERGDRDPVV